MKRLLLIVLAACVIHHHVRILLGPDENTPSSGFQCVDPNTNKPLLARAVTGSTFDAYFVVDIISFGNHTPSCLGEDIVHTCSDGTCGPLVSDGKRFCKEVHLDVTSGDYVGLFTQWLAANAQQITANAPDHPVLVRAVITQQPCTQLDTSAAGMWVPLDGSKALGCAYSCPVDLDTVDGDLSLGIAVGDSAQCVPAIAGCAAFPNL